MGGCRHEVALPSSIFQHLPILLESVRTVRRMMRRCRKSESRGMEDKKPIHQPIQGRKQGTPRPSDVSRLQPHQLSVIRHIGPSRPQNACIDQHEVQGLDLLALLVGDAVDTCLRDAIQPPPKIPSLALQLALAGARLAFRVAFVSRFYFEDLSLVLPLLRTRTSQELISAVIFLSSASGAMFLIVEESRPWSDCW